MIKNSLGTEGFCTNIEQYLICKIQSHISLYLTSFSDGIPTFIQGEKLFLNEVLQVDGMLPCLISNKQDWVNNYLSSVNQQYGTDYNVKITLKAMPNSLLYHCVSIEHNFSNSLDSIKIIDDFTRELSNEIIQTNLVAAYNAETKSHEIHLDKLMEEMPHSI